MKLHLACGANILSGWTNVDLEPQGESVIPHDLTQPLPFPNDTIELIYSEHFIEHIPKESAYAFVAQCFSKLEPGGKIRVRTPNLSRLVRQYEQGRTDSWRNVGWTPVSRADMLNQGMTLWGHHYVYDWFELEKMFRHNGFINVTRQKWGESSVDALSNIESRPDNGELILEACKPILETSQESKRPKVSVVIASYNHESYVGAAIDSVINQTFQDFEIVVTDDGSSDRTADIIANYTDPRIMLKRFEKNKGACWATNDAIRRAQGEYIAILNSDDEFLPHKLQKQVDFLDTHPEFGAVFAYPEMINEFGETLPLNEQNTHSAIFQAQNQSQTEWLLCLFNDNNLCHPSILIRRVCYDSVGLYNPSLRSLPDYEMWVRLLQFTNIYVMQECLIRMRRFSNESNESGKRPDLDRRRCWEHISVLKRFLAVPDTLWYPMINSLIDTSQLPQIVSYKRELEFSALCTAKNSLTHLMCAMQVLGAIEEESDETAAPIFKIYTELAAQLEYKLVAHNPLPLMPVFVGHQ